MRSNVGKFTKAVLRHWNNFITGGLVAGGSSIFTQGLGKVITTYAFWILAVIGLLAAFYRAWNDEYKKSIELPLPNLKGEILAYVYHEDGGGSRFFLQVRILNIGACPTIVKDWKMRICRQDGSFIEGNLEYIPPGCTLGNGVSTVIPLPAIYEVTDLIPVNGQAGGWLRGLFDGYKKTPGDTMQVELQDARGKKYFANRSVYAVAPTASISYIPGAGTIPPPEPERIVTQ